MAGAANTADLNAFLASVEKKAYAMAVVSVKSRDDALDIVQDVMFTLARKYAHKSPDEWRPLFYRMLKNRITDWHRSSTVRRRVFGWFAPSGDEDDDLDPIERAPGSEVETPEFQHGLDGLREELLHALGQLPDRQREAFVLRAWQGLDVKETAAAMGISEGSIKTHYSRAVHALRELLRATQDSAQEESSDD